MHAGRYSLIFCACFHGFSAATEIYPRLRRARACRRPAGSWIRKNRRYRSNLVLIRKDLRRAEACPRPVRVDLADRNWPGTVRVHRAANAGPADAARSTVLVTAARSPLWHGIESRQTDVGYRRPLECELFMVECDIQSIFSGLPARVYTRSARSKRVLGGHYNRDTVGAGFLHIVLSKKWLWPMLDLFR